MKANRKYQSGGKLTETIGDLKRRINSMRTTSRDNQDGTTSTHLMAFSGNDKDGYSVFPTIFPNKDGSWTDFISDDNSKESWDKTYSEAKKRGEIIGGLSRKQAEDLAGGSWKNMGKTDIKPKSIKPVLKAGGMIKRADGSYSKRGLWDNIRKNIGSKKKPTKAMLKAEKKINNEG